VSNSEDLAFALVHAAVAEVGTFHVTLKLFVALDLSFSLATPALLAYHLTTLRHPHNTPRLSYDFNIFSQLIMEL